MPKIRYGCMQKIELGYKKVYCPYAPVYHSHNFPLREYYGRYFDEYRGLNRIHGYVISDSWMKLPLLVIRHTLADLRYVRSLPLKRKEKFSWLLYSAGRNYCRYYAGYKGGRYDQIFQGEGRKGGTEEYRSNTNRERVRGYRDMKEFVIKGIRFVRRRGNQGSC